MLLQDRVCIVAGAASRRGIGRATVDLFAEHGAEVVAVDIGMTDPIAREMRQANAERLGRDVPVEGLRCDIAGEDACAALAEQVVERHGRIDCLVNCAGIVSSAGILDISANDFERMIAVNLKGAFNLCREVLRVFDRRQAGTIVNVASVAAQRGGGLVGGGHYAASKGGVVSLTKTIAREFGPRGIRANVVCPSTTETSMLDGTVSAARREEIVATVPLRRLGLARDVAGACLFLASDLSAYVTGAVIDVNGGSHIH